jgi:hypothetical protein
MIGMLSRWKVRRNCKLEGIAKEEDWAFKTWFVPLFLMDWQTLMLDVMLEFLNTFLIKDVNIFSLDIKIKCMSLANN